MTFGTTYIVTETMSYRFLIHTMYNEENIPMTIPSE